MDNSRSNYMPVVRKPATYARPAERDPLPLGPRDCCVEVPGDVVEDGPAGKPSRLMPGRLQPGVTLSPHRHTAPREPLLGPPEHL